MEYDETAQRVAYRTLVARREGGEEKDLYISVGLKLQKFGRYEQINFCFLIIFCTPYQHC